MHTAQNRRDFLKFISSSTASLSLSPLLMGSLTGCQTLKNTKPLYGLKKSREDQLRLMEGLKYQIICKWGDPINKSREVFGFNNDFTSYLPFEAKTNEGLLWVNHESVIPQMIHNKRTDQLTRSVNEIVKEQELVGGSILHLKKSGNSWERQFDSKYNRRIHGRSKIPFSQGVTIQGSKEAVGTLANCAGGQTPWRTFLTSEENYDDFYGEAYLVKGKRSIKYKKKKLDWYKQFPLPPEHYGWIVEIDPLTGAAEKKILLGRAPHEGATVTTTRSQKTVVYMGEDREGGYIYKFVSNGMNFDSGTLYAADTVKGKWIPLDIEKSPILKTNFDNQIDVLTYTHQSAEIVGATPQDRPEDIEIHPETGDVFIALTKNSKADNLYGGLLKIKEEKDHDSTEFTASVWISGGLNTGLACPDNLCFDKKGHLWVTTDMGEDDINSKEYSMFGNNGLYYIPTHGPKAGQPLLVATAPTDAEFTGPWFTPDYKTLFLSVQHPGSGTRRNLQKPTSTWPDGPGKMPKSAVVAIEGSLFDQLMS